MLPTQCDTMLHIMSNCRLILNWICPKSGKGMVVGCPTSSVILGSFYGLSSQIMSINKWQFLKIPRALEWKQPKMFCPFFLKFNSYAISFRFKPPKSPKVARGLIWPGYRINIPLCKSLLIFAFANRCGNARVIATRLASITLPLNSGKHNARDKFMRYIIN